MNFRKTEKIDDLVSLFYMIIYTLNNDKLEGLDLPNDNEKLKSNSFDLSYV